MVIPINLSKADVREIRKLFSSCWSRREIAKECGIPFLHVSQICREMCADPNLRGLHVPINRD